MTHWGLLRQKKEMYSCRLSYNLVATGEHRNTDVQCSVSSPSPDFFDVLFRPNRFAIFKAVSLLATEAVVSMRKHVFQALLYFP